MAACPAAAARLPRLLRHGIPALLLRKETQRCNWNGYSRCNYHIVCGLLTCIYSCNSRSCNFCAARLRAVQIYTGIYRKYVFTTFFQSLWRGVA